MFQTFGDFSQDEWLKLKNKLKIFNETGIIEITHLNSTKPIQNLNNGYTEEECNFEGFEYDQIRLSEFRKNLIDSHINVTGTPSDTESNSSNNNLYRFQEYTPFEVLAQQFEHELGLLPLEISLQEEPNKKFIPPGSFVDSRRKYFCYKCNASFKTKKHLNIHLHERKSCIFSCPVCPFKGNDILKHISFHSNLDMEGMLICSICKVRVHSMNGLLGHLELVHAY